MTLDEYQREAFKTARIDWSNPRKRHIPAFGTIGELGSLVSELKKSLRDGRAYTEGGQNIIEEFGDVLWYLAAICSHYKFKMSELIARSPPLKLPRRRFAHIYAMVRTIPTLTEEFESFPARPTPAQRRKLADSIGAAGRITLQALQVEKLDLATVLSANLSKVHSMFSKEIRPARCFDGHKTPDYERLPRRLHIQFLERRRGKDRREVIMRVNGLNIGDRLTDNAAMEDGYRYHDAFHLGFTAALGWSPVIRSVFRCKRKNNPQKDEVEDGARAAIIEEAIAQTVFNYALGHSMLRKLDRLDHGFLKLIRRMARNLEVNVCELHEWQRAILVGFKAFRDLTENRGGWLILNAEKQSLTYSKKTPPGARIHGR
jgi:NTP pyrophosphatase (non-canonical NTP hydrolase)